MGRLSRALTFEVEVFKTLVVEIDLAKLVCEELLRLGLALEW